MIDSQCASRKKDQARQIDGSVLPGGRGSSGVNTGLEATYFFLPSNPLPTLNSSVIQGTASISLFYKINIRVLI